MGSNSLKVYLLQVAVLTGALMVWIPAGHAEDCRRAKEFYAQGVKLFYGEERLEAFEQATKLCPSYAEAHINLADALENIALMSKDFSQANVERNNKLLDRAIKEYHEALKYDDKLFVAHLGLAENYFRIGLFAKARESYRKFLELNQNPDLASKAQDGLQSVERAIAGDKDGFKTSNEIIQRIKESSGLVSLMGFDESTVVRDRQRFINIVFKEWSYALDLKQTIAQLEEIGKALASSDVEQCKFILEGHTDPRGGYERNQKLSWDRAEAVKQYFVDRHRINPDRITTQGFGYDRPRFPNDSEANMLRNRRVELLVVEKTEQ